jgi:hypothetical protein
LQRLHGCHQTARLQWRRWRQPQKPRELVLWQPAQSATSTSTSRPTWCVALSERAAEKLLLVLLLLLLLLLLQGQDRY